jgi:hypothetical protein
MSAPPSDERERRPAQPTLPSTLTDETKVAASITDVHRSVVIDLERQRLWQPWPGWWGAAGDMLTWTWAERSRRCFA